jgi:hypothetical protein
MSTTPAITDQAAIENRQQLRAQHHAVEIARFQDEMEAMQEALEEMYADEEVSRVKGTQATERNRLVQLLETAESAKEAAAEAFEEYAYAENFDEARKAFKKVERTTKNALHKQAKADAASEWLVANLNTLL